MSESQVLYVKGMNISESEAEIDEDDQWDDKKLNDAYDKAVRIANVEVAKRVAMSTNTPSSTIEPSFFSKKEKLSIQKSMKKVIMPNIPTEIMIDESLKERKWEPGMPCRLLYIEDGLEYEAVILRFVENDDCIVKYLGYENQEMVAVDSLKPSHGKEARTRQIQEARREQAEENVGCMSPDLYNVGCNDRGPSPDSVDRGAQKKRKPSKKKKPRNLNFNGFDLPEMPPMPNISMLRNQLGSTEMPMPPPPIAFATMDRTDSEDHAISSMLLSWYMSGYYTGLYQGLKRAKDGRKN